MTNKKANLPRALPESLDAWVEYPSGAFEEAYWYMRGVTDFPPAACFVAAWLSVGKDDRGEVQFLYELAEILGVTRETLGNWRTRYQLDEWAMELRLMRMRGSALGEVDRVTYLQAVEPDSSVEARRLFYQRAGVLTADVTIRDKTRKEMLDEWLRELRDLDGD